MGKIVVNGYTEEVDGNEATSVTKRKHKRERR